MWLEVVIVWCVYASIYIRYSAVGAADTTDLNTLRFVHLLWRHGDRSPAVETFPTDTDNPESSWPQGWGELTTTGMRQHYALGQYLRRRYDGYLSQRYSKYEVFVRSTSYNRTIMSAMSNMAGLYPPSKDQQWSEDIPWQPVPVHSWPVDMDNMLISAYPCPMRERLWRSRVKSSAAYRKLEAEYAEFLDFLRDKTGLPLEKGLMSTGRVYDPLFCERCHPTKHSNPAWVTADPDLYRKIVEMFDRVQEFHFYDVDVLKLTSGLLMGDILTRMLNRAKNVTDELDPRLKAYIYSAHDTTVLPMLQSLGVFNGRMPPYAACLGIELHERPSTGSDAQTEHYVELWYRNSSAVDARAMPLDMPECPRASCTLAKFATAVAAYIPADFDADCRPWWHVTTGGYAAFMTVVCVVLALFNVIMLLPVGRLCRRRYRRYIGRHLVPTTNIDSDDDTNNYMS